VSNGITAAEWFTRLCMDYPRLQFTASDWVLFLVEARRTEVGDIYILDPDGTPIQYIRPPFVVSLVQPQHWFYVVNRRLQRQALHQWSQKLEPCLRIPTDLSEQLSAGAPLEAPPFVLRQLPLVHPDTLRLRGEQFHIRRHSVFEALQEPTQIIRTMNILNHAYFSEAQLKAAVSAVKASLVMGGVWIVGRTTSENPPQHDVTVYQKQKTGWQVMLRSGAGSEIEPIVNAL